MTTRSFVEIAQDLWSRRKWLAVAVFILVASVVVSVARFLPNVYRSSATVLIERNQISESFVRPAVTIELETRLQTVSQEVFSRGRLAELITRFDLYPEITRKGPVEGAVERMRKDIHLELKSVEQGVARGGTIAFIVGYRGRDPQVVAAVANALAAFYVEQNSQLRERQTVGTTQVLQAQLAEVKKRLAAQELRIRAFRAQHTGELPEQIPVNLATLERLSTRLQLSNDAQMRALERRATLMRQLAETEATPPTAAPDTKQSQLAKMKRELRQLRTRFSDQYPDVRRLRADIAALEETMAEAGEAEPAPTERGTPSRPLVAQLRAAIDEINAEVTALKAEETHLRSEIVTYQRRTENAPQREKEFQELSRDYDAIKELYTSVLRKNEDAQLAGSMEQQQKGEQFRILDVALPSAMPSAPNRLRIIAFGIIAALGAAGAAVAIAQHLDTTFHTVDHLRSMTTLPVLTSIPLLEIAGDRWRARRRFALALVAVLLALGVASGASRHLAEGNYALAAALAGGGS
jgi:polysaccharide chain length determinant protein (PEP-CTERM system associated)